MREGFIQSQCLVVYHPKKNVIALMFRGREIQFLTKCGTLFILLRRKPLTDWVLIGDMK